MLPGTRAVAEDQTAHHISPFLKTNEEQISRIRRQLEGMFRELRLVQDVIVVCSGYGQQARDVDDEAVEHVLRRCGADRMNGVLKTLNEIVQRFGGSTELSEAPKQEQSAA